jgi:resuscitation-promoting factor RpfB
MFGSRLTERLSLRALGGAVAATAVIATSLVTAPAASAASTKTVTLTVNGVTSKVQTSADTVRQLLNERAVPFDKTDLITPAAGTPITWGMAVSWKPAIRVVVKDGTDRTAHRVTATRAAGVVTELQLPTGVEATYTRMEAYSFQVGRLYSPAGRPLAGDDRVAEDSIAIVHRVRLAFADDRIRFKPEVVRDRSKLVAQGSTKVWDAGRAGVKKVVYRKRFVDGELAGKRIVKSRVVRDGERRVVRVGTGPNWTGLARCESGGNPKAYNPAGFYGLYQFSLSTWRALGGKGLPTDYGYWEQTKRAWKLYKASGRSPWPHCGVYL